MTKKESTESIDVKQEFVYIRRIPRNSRLGKDILDKSRVKLSAFSKRNTLVLPEPGDTPLGKQLYPRLLNISDKDVTYAKAIEQYILDTAWAVPPDEGLKLNITVIGNTIAIPEDFIAYLTARKHIDEGSGYVVDDVKDGSGKAMFYLYYPEAEKMARASILDDEADAIFEMSSMFKDGDKDKIDWILSFFGYNPYIIDEKEKKLIMNDIIKGRAKYSGEMKLDKSILRYGDRPAKFFEQVCLDKNIELKSKIETLIRGDIVTIIGSKYYFGEIELGNTLDGIVIRLLDKTPDSTNLLRQLEARYDVIKDELKSKKAL